MPKFEIKAGNQIFDVEAASAEDAWEGFQMMLKDVPQEHSDVAGQVLKGAPVLGAFVDQAGAAVSAASHPLTGVGKPGETFGERYQQNLQDQKLRAAKFEMENPGVSTALGIGGAVLGTAPLAALGPAQIGARALGMVGNLPGRMVQGAVGGGAIGAADAYVREQNPLLGAVVGTGMGAAAPVVGTAAAAGVNRLGEATAPATSALANYSRGAVGKVSRAFGDDAVTPATTRALGPEGMLLDAGPNLQLQAQSLATQPGSARKTMQDAVTSRFKGTAGRIEAEVDQVLGPYQNFHATQQAAIKGMKAEGDKLYGEAWAAARPVDVSPVIAEINKTVSPGLSSLVEGAGPSPNSIQAVLGGVRDKLARGQAQRVSAQDLHVVKMDLDDMIGQAKRAGADNQARLLIGVKNSLVDALDNATVVQTPQGPVSLYQQARAKYASDASVIDALEEGKSLFKKNTRPDELAEQWRGMSAAEQEAYRVGARDAVDEVMYTSTNSARAASDLFGKNPTDGKHWNARKLAMAVGDNEAQKLLGIIERETKFRKSFGDVETGSHTAGRQAAQKEFPNKVDTDTQLLGATVPGLLALGAKKLFVDPMRSASRAAKIDREAAQAAGILTKQGPQRDALVQALYSLRQRQAATAPIASKIDDLATILMQSQQGPVRSAIDRRYGVGRHVNEIANKAYGGVW
jgi:hypothetical protein